MVPQTLVQLLAQLPRLAADNTLQALVVTLCNTLAIAHAKLTCQHAHDSTDAHYSAGARLHILQLCQVRKYTAH